jgi:phospholipase/carboxylesterase
MVYEAFRIPHVVEGRSQVSPVSSRALLLDDMVIPLGRETSLAPEPPVEPAHLHGVTDTSVHLCIPADHAAQVCRLGWGEPHGYADHSSEIMVYGPRDADELQVVVGLLHESVDFARHGKSGAGK